MSLTLWIAAVAAGAAASAALYVGRRASAPGGSPRRLVGPAVLRAAAATLLAALLLDAPVSLAPAGRSIVVVDASRSWLRGNDGAAWRSVRERVRRADAEVLLAGDSVRAGPPPERPVDDASALGPAVERAAASGRPVTLLTDGEIDDADALAALPAGSVVETIAPRRSADAALARLDAPATAAAGDSVTVRVTVAADSLGAPARRISVRLGQGAAVTAPVPALPAYGELTVELRVPGARAAGPVLVAAALGGPPDGEAGNDTLLAPLEVTATPAAVFVSTAPDFDARYALDVLRGSLSLPATGYFRVAPGAWRDDRTFAAVPEPVVRAALRAAPVAALHGDTSYFGPPRQAAAGALVLVPSFDDRGEEWYAAAAPPSPLAGALGGTAWDSLPPIGTSLAPPAGEWTALSARQRAAGALRPLVVGREGGRRVAVVAAAGLWRWRFRGGASADAFAALWGGIFDWLAEGRSDRRAAQPAQASRAGEPVHWRRGADTSSVVLVSVVPRNDPRRVIPVRVRFPAGAMIAESAPLAPGVYDVRAPGGPSVLVVNPSAEWVPRRPTVRATGARAAAAAPGVVGLRSHPWAFVLLLALLSAEWLLRRRLSLS